MSELLDAFRRKHQEKLDQLEHGEVDDAFLDGLHVLVADLRRAGSVVADPAERGQLRALMRFWGNVVYERAGTYPDTTLSPLDPANVRPHEGPVRRPLPPLVWVLVGGAAVIVIVVGLIAVGWLPQLIDGDGQESVAMPTVPVSPVVYAIVNVGVGQNGIIKTYSNTFCRDVAEIAAELTFEGTQPDMAWYWEVRRGEEVVVSQPAVPWAQTAQHTAFTVMAGGAGTVEPGRYDLLIYADEHVAGGQSFRVLDAMPRALDLWVSDVPEADGQAPNELAAGLRVLYLHYDYEGMCYGTAVSHTLYREGVLAQEIVGMWSGDPQGRARVSFQAPGSEPFPPGDYEVSLSVAGEEQGRVRFVIGEEAEALEEVVGPPAFGDIAIALGVRPDGAPVLAQGTPFGWSTRVVHAIFDYTGMSSGVRWSAMWTRDGTEVATEEYVWDAETAGSEGTYWVVLSNEDGEPLDGGNYSVTLFIEGRQQGAADFRIYYRPAE